MIQEFPSRWRININAVGLAPGYYYSICVDAWREKLLSSSLGLFSEVIVTTPSVLEFFTFEYIQRRGRRFWKLSEDMDGLRLRSLKASPERVLEPR